MAEEGGRGQHALHDLWFTGRQFQTPAAVPLLLYAAVLQAEAMTKHYKTPVLLIEFEGDKAFALQVRVWGRVGGLGGAGWQASVWR